MSEENQGQEGQQNEPTAVELKAMDMGWRPKEEWEGDEELFVDAKEFVARQPLFDKINSLKGAAENAQASVRALMEHNAKIEALQYEKALKKLRAEKTEARKEGDLERYDEIQEEIEETEKQAAVKPQLPQPAQIPMEVQNWVARNSWYAKDARLKAFADTIGIEGNNNGLKGQPLLDYIEKEVKKEFPHKFQNPNRARQDVEGSGTGKGNGRERGNEYKLDEREERIMKSLVASKTMTKEEYIKQLRAAKGD